MDFLSKIRESPNYERLKKSVEVKACVRDLLIFGALLIFFALLIAAPAADNRSNAGIWAILLFVLVPCVLYFSYKLIEIFLYIDCYSFTEVVLDRPRQGYRGVMYFTVTIRDRHGRELEVDTRHIFSQGNPNFEEYVNQRALIGYNDQTERVVVVQQLP